MAKIAPFFLVTGMVERMRPTESTVGLACGRRCACAEREQDESEPRPLDEELRDKTK